MAKKKKSKSKFNNPYKVPNDKADEIRALSNPELVSRAALEYENTKMFERIKKNDTDLNASREQMKTLKQDIESHPEYIEAKEALRIKKEELISETQASLEEEIKNLAQPLNEDIQNSRGLFKVAMDEVNARKQSGTLKIT